MSDTPKTKKEIVKDMLARNEADIVQMEVREKYLIERALKEPKYNLALGQLQSELKEAREWVAFLKKQ